MIKFGPAGIPLSCKGRTLRDGIVDVHSLGLTALEYQILRVNVIERSPYDDEIGKTMAEVGEFVFEIVRREKKKVTVISDMEEKIRGKDTLRILLTAPTRNVA
ncbi:MAG: endonuclease IV, partial [Thermoplasmata archaeon]|nr:endonuclease IV [Thermoplasmata archaeon]